MTNYALVYNPLINKPLRVQVELMWKSIHDLTDKDMVVWYSEQEAKNVIAKLDFPQQRKLRMVSEDELEIIKVLET